MLQLLLLVLAAVPPGAGMPDRVILRDPQNGPTPVTNLYLIPPKLHDCRTDAEVQAALEKRRYGEQEPCDPDRMIRRSR